MKAITTSDAPILIPNLEHKNFTDSGEVIEENTIVNGNAKNIEGLRKGKPFTYKLFVTDKNQLIHLNKIKTMETTEVTLGADANVSATKVDMKPAEISNKNKFIGTVVGGIAGFAFAKYKKHDVKKQAMFIAIGAVAGYVAGMLIDKRSKVTIKASK
jgi:hypothetical protein